MKNIYKLFILFFLTLSINLAFAAIKDTDWDSFTDDVDNCIYWTTWTPYSSWTWLWCDEKQKNLITTNTWSFTDYDGDRLSNDIEINWYTWTTFSWTRTSDPTLKDTDNDWLSDLQEYTIWTNPRNSDTDWDWIKDWIDIEPLTLEKYKTLVNWSWSCDQSCLDKYTTKNSDRDNDGIQDINEKLIPWCLNTDSWAQIFKDWDQNYIWCSVAQKRLKQEFDDIKNTLAAQIVTTSGALSTWSWKDEEVQNFINDYNDYEYFISQRQDDNSEFYSWIIDPAKNPDLNPDILNKFISDNKQKFSLNWVSTSNNNTWSALNVDAWDPNVWSNRWSYLDKYAVGSSTWNTRNPIFWHFTWSLTWEKWSKNLLINIAQDMKNLFIAIAVIYLLIITFRFFFWGGGDDDLKKWRSWILWTSVWIMLMQVSFVAIQAIYNQQIWEQTASNFSDVVLWPIIHLLEVIASFIFIAMAILAFFRMVTWWWNEDWYKKWVQTITSAIVWFILIKISSVLVFSIYWKVKCETSLLWTWTCNWDALWKPNLSATVEIARNTIQFFTWFIWIFVIIMIIYAWFLVLTSWGNDEKVKKFKSIIKYIIFWMLLIFVSVVLFQFLWGYDLQWVIWSFSN